MLISIITVTYNAEATLERTLQSVEQQTYGQIEHIIVDGLSTDSTVGMAQAYKARAKHPVVVVSERDKGLYDAMNKAIAIATGDFMVFLNAGDKLHDDSVLQRVASAAASSDKVAIVYGDTAIVDADEKFLNLRRLRPPHQLTWLSFRQGMLVCHQAFYMRRAISPLYSREYKYSSDFDWCIRCMKESERRGMKNVMAPGVLADYLDEGLTTAHHKESLQERMHIMMRHYGHVSTIVMHLWFAVRNLMDRYCKAKEARQARR